MSVGKVGPDGKIRVRCQQCGKKLKMSAGRAGKIYNCPICGGTVVAPLDQAEVGGTGDEAMLTERDMRRLGWTPSLTRREKYASLEKLGNFLSREYAEIAQMAARILSAETLSVNQANDKILEMRKELAVKIKNFSVTLVRDVEQELYNLEHHPLRKQQGYGDRADAKRRELRDLKLFLKLMFNLTIATDQQENGQTEGEGKQQAQTPKS